MLRLRTRYRKQNNINGLPPATTLLPHFADSRRCSDTDNTDDKNNFRTFMNCRFNLIFFKESLTGFSRNLSTTLGSIITIFLSLLIIGVFLVGGGIVDNIVNSVEDKVSVTAYVSDDANQNDINAGWFRPSQARILLAAALATGTDPAELFTQEG